MSAARWPWSRPATRSRSTSHRARSISTSATTRWRAAAPPGNRRRRDSCAVTAPCMPSTSVRPTRAAISILSPAGHPRRSRKFTKARTRRRASRLLGVPFGIGPVPVLENIHEAGNGLRTIPVALKLTIELRFADQLATGLLDATQRGLMRRDRGSADRVGDRIDFIPFLQSVQRRECQARFRPERGHDQLLAPGRYDRLFELDIFPAIDRGAVVGRIGTEHVRERLNRWLVFAGRDIDRRVDDGKAIVDGRFGCVNDIEYELFLIHGAD